MSPIRTAIVRSSLPSSVLTKAIDKHSNADSFHLTPDGELLFKGKEVPLNMLDLYDVVHIDNPAETHSAIGFKATTREKNSTVQKLLDNRLPTLAGVETPKRFFYKKSDNLEQDFWKLRETVRYPFVVRPVYGGENETIIIKTDEELRAFLSPVTSNHDVLFEEHLEGSTVWVLVLPGFRGEATYTAVPIGKVADGVYQPVSINDPLKTNLLEKAIETAGSLGIEKFAMLSFRITDDGRILFLKGNPYPDQLETKQFDASLESVGITEEELARHLLSSSL